MKIYAELTEIIQDRKSYRIKSLQGNKLFHIHIGYKNYNADTSIQLVKYLDQYLGIPSIIRDQDKKRRSLYGKAGCFRLTGYGVEYRVLSSALMKDEESLDFVWQKTMRAIQMYNEGASLLPTAVVQDIINNTKVKTAEQVIADYNL